MTSPEALGPALASALQVAADAYRALLGGTSLDRALEQALATRADGARLRAAAMDLVYTATRRRALADAVIRSLAPRPPALAVKALLVPALAQLQAERHAGYAVVDQTVRAAKAHAETAAAAGFVNGVLRNFLRQRAQLLPRLMADPTVEFNLPAWWIARLRRAYPQQWRQIAHAQLQPPPLVLRVNPRRVTVAAYLQRLNAAGLPASQVGPQAVWLHTPRPVDAIPGFAEGDVSVQDAGAQLAAFYLQVSDGMRVLDACAAPGGKTGHLAELADVQIDAVEVDPKRAARIEANLNRLGVNADRPSSGRMGRVRVHHEAVEDFARRSAHGSYDRILLDAPCTGSGVVRRHPDIPWLRQVSDVAQLATQQARMLNSLWPLLAPAGRLVFVVCSLFPEEASMQAARFLQEHPDARRVGQDLQLVPTDVNAVPPYAVQAELPTLSDGFFYAIFEKKTES